MRLRCGRGCLSRRKISFSSLFQLTDAEFGSVVSAVYGSADAPGRIVASGVAAERLDLQAVPVAPLISFIRDSYEAWLSGSSDEHSQAAAGGGRASLDGRLKPELVLVRGKVCCALSRLRLQNRPENCASPQDLLSLLQAADFAGSGRLEWTSVARVLVEDVHLAIDGGGDARPDLSEGDHAMIARQVARAEAQQREAASALAPAQRDEASLNLARDEELALLRVYREGHKSDVIRRRLQDAITASVALYPRFGQAAFFEFTLRNPFTYEERFVVRIDDPTCPAHSAAPPELRVITDMAEARVLRSTLPRACADAGLAVVSGASVDPGFSGARAGAVAELLDTPQFRAHGELLLQPGEHITLPLVFLSMQVSDATIGARFTSACALRSPMSL